MHGMPRRRRQSVVGSWLTAAALVAVAASRHGGQAAGLKADTPRVDAKLTQTTTHAVLPAQTALPSTQPRTLLWIPVHASEPTANLEAMADCVFARHTPSLAGENFDIFITLSGNASDGREEAMAGIVRHATAHIGPVRPTVRVQFVHVAKDVYDRDVNTALRSSFAGPNAVFYAVMADALHNDDSVDETKKNTDDGDLDGSKGYDANGAALMRMRTMLLYPNSGELYRTHIAPYDFVQVVETDCCALRSGWLDALVEPMIRDPDILISGSRTRAPCYSSDGATHCKTRVEPHLKLHINGNAMYRVGPALQRLVSEARDNMLDKIPFDLAMFFVRKDNQSHLYDNPRVHSMGAPVDLALWDEPAYYGVDQDAAFVHAPRRLRQDGVQAVASRVDRAHHVSAVVVAPSVYLEAPSHALDEASSGHLATDVPLLRSCHQALHAAAADHNVIYIALTWPAFVEASRLAPFRVLLANDTQKLTDDAWPDPAALASRALTALTALARADLDVLVMGTDAAMVRPGVDEDLRAMCAAGSAHTSGGGRGRPTLRLLQSPGGAAPLAPAPYSRTSDRAVLDVGIMQVPKGEAAAAFLQHWADGLHVEQSRRDGTRPAWHQADGVMAALTKTCRVWRRPGCLDSGGANLTVDWLPAEAYASSASYWGPAWTAEARKEAAFVVAAGVGSTTHAVAASPEFRLRQAGLWHSGPAAGCANYSAVARLPMSLGQDVFSLHRTLARHAHFLGRLARHRIACAVLPGFTLASTGNAVPFDTVLRAEVVAELASGTGSGAPTPAVRFFPSAASLDVEYGSFVDVVGVEGGARLRHRRPGLRRPGIDPGAPQNAGPTVVAPMQAGKSPPSTARQEGRRLLAHGPPPPSRTTTTTAATTSATRTSTAPTHACAVFGLPDTSCFAPGVAAAIDTAATALPPRLWCVADPGRSLAEAAVLALEGRLHEVDGLIQRTVGGDGATILLTGAAWRATAAARAAGDRGARVLTLADLPGVPSSDPIFDLVRPDTPAPLTSAAASPWADVIEYALCQEAAGVRFLPAGGVPGLLLPHGTAASALLPRLAARVPPSLLHEDLQALSTWVARPDRPGLGGRWVRTRWAWRPSDRRGGRNSSSPPLSELTPANGADMLTSTMRHVYALDATLGFVPGLPPTGSDEACTGRWQPVAWSSAFGSAVLREAYASTHGQLLPPAAAALMSPEAALDVLRGGSLPVIVGGPGFRASSHQLDEPRHAQAVAAVRHVLDSRAGWHAHTDAGLLHRGLPRTMWMNSSLVPNRMARLKHLVGRHSVVAMDHVLELPG